MSLITLVNQSWPNWANQWQTDRTTLVTAPPWPPPPPPCRPPPPETPRRPPNQVFTSVGPADFFPRQRLLFFPRSRIGPAPLALVVRLGEDGGQPGMSARDPAVVVGARRGLRPGSAGHQSQPVPLHDGHLPAQPPQGIKFSSTPAGPPSCPAPSSRCACQGDKSCGGGFSCGWPDTKKRQRGDTQWLPRLSWKLD